MDITKNFQRELRSLLEKYGAEISWECDDCSDTYGISGEKMVIDADGKRLFSINGDSIEASDLYKGH